MPRRILLTQLRRIGDVMMTTPAVAAVRAAFPEAHLTYVTEAPAQHIFRHSRDVDEVLVAPRGKAPGRLLRFVRALRRRRFDVAVDFFGNPRSALLAWLSGAPRRIGFDFRGRRRLYTEPVALTGRAAYSGDHKAALVEPLGVQVTDLTPRLPLSAAEREVVHADVAALGVRAEDLFVVLWPISRQPYKRWPLAHYARLADILIERYGAKVLLYYGPGEEDVTNAVRLEMRHTALPDYPAVDLLEMAALFERAHLFIGNDGGPRHFAVAVGTPTLTVFGKDRPATWTPPGPRQHRTVEHDPGCKDTCHYPRCGLECLNELPYARVEQELETLLEELLRDGTPDRRGPAGAPA